MLLPALAVLGGLLADPPKPIPRAFLDDPPRKAAEPPPVVTRFHENGATQGPAPTPATNPAPRPAPAVCSPPGRRTTPSGPAAGPSSRGPARYWIHLTNEPGVRAFGRIENGFAVDIIRREPIAGYTPTFPFLSPAASCPGGRCPR